MCAPIRSRGNSRWLHGGLRPLCLAETVITSTERLVDTNGVQLRVIEAGERGAPVVVLAHGFPELAYSWRHQIPALADAGYHVLAPDQRGYGGSAGPTRSTTTTSHALTGDLVGLLDDVGAEQAVFVGHDWGAMVAWHTAAAAPGPGRRRSSGMSVPPVPRPQVPPHRDVGARSSATNFFYMLYFQEPGVADAELAATRRTMRGRRPIAGGRCSRGLASSTGPRAGRCPTGSAPGRVRPLRRPSSPEPGSPAG